MNIKEHFTQKAIYLEIRKLRSEISKGINVKDNEEKLTKIRDYSVDLLNRIKNKEDEAFNELIQLKDIRNFIYHYSFYIRKYHKFKVDEQNVLHELRFQIFYHISQNYRIYNEPHEISLLIVSMRSWIRQKVSRSLKGEYDALNDAPIDPKYLEDNNSDFTKVMVDEILDDYLDDQENDVFKLRFYGNYQFNQIGEMLGISIHKSRRTFERAKLKLKSVLEKEGEDSNE